MRPLFSSYSLPLLLLFISTFHAINANRLIHETCKKCSQKDPNLSYNFCVNSLQAVPKSQSVDDLRELGKISIKLIKQNVTDTRNHIKNLLGNKSSDSFIESCLSDCFDLYSDAVPTLSQALKDYKAKRYDDANIEVSSVLDASTTCEDGFVEKKGVVSPLTKRNNNTFQLSAIALSIVNMLNWFTHVGACLYSMFCTSLDSYLYFNLLQIFFKVFNDCWGSKLLFLLDGRYCLHIDCKFLSLETNRWSRTKMINQFNMCVYIYI